MTELEFRDSVQVVGVSFPKSEIELVVMPYESPTMVEYHGRMIEEVVSRGAFDGIERRTGGVKVNLDHKTDVANQIGRTIALHPSRQEGLVAEVKVRRNHPLAEVVMESADEDDLGASAGFALLFDENYQTYPDAEEWESRSRRRLKRLYLGHIALTPQPAYAQAKVLAVRSQQPPVTPTPNRDWLELERLRALYADIDARYGLSR